MIFHENRLPADDSHEISCLICYFEKAAKFEIVVCCKIIGCTLRINTKNDLFCSQLPCDCTGLACLLSREV